MYFTKANQNPKVDAHTNKLFAHNAHMTKITMKRKGKLSLIATSVHNKSVIAKITNIEVTGAVIKC